MRLPTRLDRYPAKMVSKLADRLIHDYAKGAKRVLDPFCGSGAVLVAAQRRGIPVSGVDINPIAGLFSSVKFNGFDAGRVRLLADAWIRGSKKCRERFPVNWSAKTYWFSTGTLDKFERLRAVATKMRLNESREGIALLLSYALAIRLCSRADQRSPKPFISKQARLTRRGRHFDPYRIILALLDELSCLYGRIVKSADSCFLLANVAGDRSLARRLGIHSHVITSPPYINAQDYFRNFKLELHLLEGVLPFQVEDVRQNFIGTERGDLLAGVSRQTLQENFQTVPHLKALQRCEPRLAAVVHRYFSDMGRAFNLVKKCLEPNGSLILVCGDNLIGGFRIRTWQILERLLCERGFVLADRFSDPINDRLLPPKRSGHKGLIKEEVVSLFRLRGNKRTLVGTLARGMKRAFQT